VGKVIRDGDGLDALDVDVILSETLLRFRDLQFRFFLFRTNHCLPELVIRTLLRLHLLRLGWLFRVLF
jgi:hypothetical protein